MLDEIVLRNALKGEQNVFPVSTSQSAISILLRDMVKTLEYDVFTIIISNFYQRDLYLTQKHS